VIIPDNSHHQTSTATEGMPYQLQEPVKTHGISASLNCVCCRLKKLFNHEELSPNRTRENLSSQPKTVDSNTTRPSVFQPGIHTDPSNPMGLVGGITARRLASKASILSLTSCNKSSNELSD